MLKQRPPAYTLTITFKTEDLDLIDQARMLIINTGSKATYRQIFLEGCKALIEQQIKAVRNA